MENIIVKYFPVGRRFYSGGQILSYYQVAEMMVKGLKVTVLENKTYENITESMVKRALSVYIRKTDIDHNKVIKIARILK